MLILICKIFAQQIFSCIAERKLPDLFMTFDNNKFININMNINTINIDISLWKIHAHKFYMYHIYNRKYGIYIYFAPFVHVYY